MISLPAAVALILFADSLSVFFSMPFCDNYITPKETSLGLAAVIIAILILCRGVLSGAIKFPRIGKAGAALFLWVSALFLSSMLSAHSSYSIGAMKIPLIYAALYLIFSYLASGNPRNSGNISNSDNSDNSDNISNLNNSDNSGASGVHRAGVALSIAGLLFSVHGIAQFYDYDFLSFHSRYSLSETPQLHVYSLFGNANLLAEFLALSIPASVYYLLSGKDSLLIRIACAVSAVASIVAVIMTGSRSALIASTISVFLVIVMSSNKSFFTGKFRRITSAAFAILILFAVSFGVYYSSTRVLGKSGSVSLRLLYWKAAVEMFEKKPIIGNGVGSFQINYPEYQKKYFEDIKSIELCWFASMEKPGHPHNEYLNTLVDSGLTGAIPFILIFAFCLIAAFKQSSVARRQSSAGCSESSLWGAVVASFSVLCLFGFPLRIPTTGFILPLAAACLDHPPIFSESKKIFYEFKLPSKLNSKFAKLLLASVVFAALIPVAVIQLNPLLARIHITEARKALLEGRLDSAKHQIAAALKIYPDWGEAFFTLGALRDYENKPDEAISCYLKAKETSSDINILFNIGLAQEAAGHIPDAIKTMREMEAFSPCDLRPKKKLALYYINQGKYQDAANILNQILIIRPGDTETSVFLSKLKKTIK